MDDHDRGLEYDLSTLLRRRRMLGLLAGAGLATLVGCSNDAGTTTSSPTTAGAATTGAASATGTPATTAANCSTEIPEETAGPYPGNGSNGANVLTRSGIVRSDIRASFGSSTTVAKGVPLTIRLTVQDATKSCAALAGAAVYLWQCDINGRYSLYSQGITGQN
jgi:hypothetical protein